MNSNTLTELTEARVQYLAQITGVSPSLARQALGAASRRIGAGLLDPAVYAGAKKILTSEAPALERVNTEIYPMTWWSDPMTDNQLPPHGIGCGAGLALLPFLVSPLILLVLAVLWLIADRRRRPS